MRPRISTRRIRRTESNKPQISGYPVRLKSGGPGSIPALATCETAAICGLVRVGFVIVSWLDLRLAAAKTT